MTDIHFDVRIGGGTTPLIGAVTFTPTRVRYDETSVTLPEPQVCGLHNGKGVMPAVAPSPAGVSPAWAYTAEVIDGTTGKKKSWLVRVPDQESVQFDDLDKPARVIDPMIDINALADAVDGAVRSIEVDEESGDVTVLRVDGGTYLAGNAKGPKGGKGDKGNDGAGIPSGGAAGQVPARTPDGGSAWANVADLIPTATTSTNGLLAGSDKAKLFGNAPLGDAHLDTVIEEGKYNQFQTEFVTTANGYPISGSSCDLDVVPFSTAPGRVTQTLTYVANGRKLHRRTSDGGATWSEFTEYARLSDALNAPKDYTAPYDYELPISDTVNFEHLPGAGLRITRTADTVQLTGIIRTKTSGYINTGTARKVAQLPPDAIPFTKRLMFWNFSTSNGSYRVRLNSLGELAVLDHSTGNAGAQIAVNCNWITASKPDTYFDRFFGRFLEGVEYQVTSLVGNNPTLASIAIHGGEVEPGSEECARELADRMSASLYTFDTMLNPVRGEHPFNIMHPSSNGFDDPRALAVVGSADHCLSFHGSADNNYDTTGAVTFVGGADAELRLAVSAKLRAYGFVTRDNPSEFPLLAGTHPANICNQTTRMAGVQLEPSAAQRRAFFPNGDTSRSMRKSGARTPEFTAYMDAVEAAVREVAG